MSWFKRKKAPSTRPAHADEIAAHKNTIKQAARAATNASINLNDLIKNNGFTVIIAASMGAKHGRADNGH